MWIDNILIVFIFKWVYIQRKALHCLFGQMCPCRRMSMYLFLPSPSHCNAIVRQLLDENLKDRWIGKQGVQIWLRVPISCGSYLKEKDYQINPKCLNVSRVIIHMYTSSSINKSFIRTISYEIEKKQRRVYWDLMMLSCEKVYPYSYFKEMEWKHL